MKKESRTKLLYEIAWNHSITYETLAPWLIKELLTICNPKKTSVLSKKQQLEVALVLLKNTRWQDNPESLTTANLTTEILEQNTHHWPEITNELLFHQAIIARNQLDYPTLETLSKKITENDPMWKLRKSSLLTELGQLDIAEQLIIEAYKKLLGQHRSDRNSIHILSRLSWSHWLYRGINALKPGETYEAFPSTYNDFKCSPWDHIEHLQTKVSKAIEKERKQPEIELLFEPGAYRDNSNTVTIDNSTHPAILLESISCLAGMPLRCSHVNFLADTAARAATLGEIENSCRFSLAIRSAHSDSSDVLKSTFSRIQIACLPQNEIDIFLGRCLEAVDYWNSKFVGERGQNSDYSISRLQVLVEVLARLSIRTTPEKAKSLFRLAVKFGKGSTFNHRWLNDPLKHLMEYSLASIPDSHHHEILLDALSFPLENEINSNTHRKWPNPIIKYPGNRVENTSLDRRLDEIIDQLVPNSPENVHSLLRLIPLLENGFLTDKEKLKITEKIWGTAPDYQVLPEAGIFMCALLKLPTQETNILRDRVRKYLFEAKDQALFNQLMLQDIVYAANSETVRAVSYTHLTLPTIYSV